MLVEVVVLHRLLHVLNDLLVHDFLPVKNLLFLHFFVRLLIAIIVNVDGSVFVHNQKFVYVLFFGDRLEPLHYFHAAFFLQRRLLKRISLDKSFAHQQRVERVNVSFGAPHDALQLRLVLFALVSGLLRQERSEIECARVLLNA